MKELYSSRVKDLVVKGRSTHPRREGNDLSRSVDSEGWVTLGRFTAENKRGGHTFVLPQRHRVRCAEACLPPVPATCLP